MKKSIFKLPAIGALLLTTFLFFFSAPSAKAQIQCCCDIGATIGCFNGNAAFDCDMWCPILNAAWTNAGSTAPYPDPATCAAACVVPIELEYFKAEMKDGKGVELNWRTLAELDNAGFEIERMSGIKLAWETIGFVEGQGTTFETHDYLYYDETPPLGINYYRLKQIDFGGASSYSPAEVVNHDARSVFSVWPTLASDYVFTLVNEKYHGSDARLEVRDMMGRKVLEQESAIVGAPIEIQSLSKGHYVVNLLVQGQVYTQRFVKVE